MEENQRVTPYPSGESVGAFYDQMSAFFASAFGEHLHFGLWDQDDDSPMETAQVRLTDRLVDLLNPRSDEYVLDVGCGTGHPAIRLAQRTGARVLGVSVSSSQVAGATAASNSAGLSTRVEFVQADAMKLPYEAGTFDAAWAIEMLFHVPDRLHVLREIRRTLKPGGRMVLTDFVMLEPLTGQEWELLAQGFAFSSLIHPDSYADVITRAGLEVVQVHDVTAHTRATTRGIAARFERDKEQLAAVYGAEFATQMELLLPLCLSLVADKIGYVIAKARRPHDA
ncbi:methyltransferase domain-containing protein [Streptomyces sp. NPDC001581]|uniref:SAM-dependent methyltransferase n=1 Tax=Streptomyces sp. NPDC001581 TaxID=3154386 RepID=UPI00332BDE76